MDFDTCATFSIGLEDRYGEKLIREEVVRLIAGTLAAFGFDGFTVRDVEGYWKGSPEKSLEVMVVFSGGPRAIVPVADIARCFAIAFRQEAVLYQISTVTAGLVYASPEDDDNRY